jgi:hypothetical protein
MARRKIEMHQYRQALLRLRQGDSDRQIAAAKLMVFKWKCQFSTT